MNPNEIQNNAKNVLDYILLITGLFIINEYLYQNEINLIIGDFNYIQKANIFLAINIHPVFKLLFRVFYVLSIIGINTIKPTLKKGKEYSDREKAWYLSLAIIVNFLIILGFLNIPIYDKYIFLIVFISAIVFTARAISAQRNKVQQDKNIFENSNVESDFYFKFGTNNGQLMIHKPNMNIMLEARPGYGKSEIIKNILVQAVKRQYPGFIYDFKGDSRKKEKEPELTNIIYTAIKKEKEINEDYSVNIEVIDFVDMANTGRINLLSDQYIDSELDLHNMAANLMNNLKGEDTKSDFWQGYGTSLVYSVFFMLYKNYKEQGFNTLPHAISVLNSDYNSLFEWLASDKELTKSAASLMSAWKAGSENTLSGALVTAQVPFSKLQSKEIFWVLNGNNTNEVNLDVNNPSTPTFLCVCNASRRKAALTPVIACITEVVMNQMNTDGKLNSIFVVDEIPTIKIEGLQDFISTARGRGVSTILGLQSYSQFKKDYKEDLADSIRDCCGNFLIGNCGIKTAKEYSDFFGEIKVKNQSFSESFGGNSNITESESLQREKILQPRDIGGQGIGHFLGSIAGGKPPFFFSQFDQFEFEPERLVPNKFPVLLGNQDSSAVIDKQREILNYHVQMNYDKINRDVEEMLEPFMEMFYERNQKTK